MQIYEISILNFILFSLIHPRHWMNHRIETEQRTFNRNSKDLNVTDAEEDAIYK